MLLHRSKPRHGRVITEDGAPVREPSRIGYVLGLSAEREPQPGPADPTPLRTAQSMPGRTLGLRVPEPVAFEDQLGRVFAEAGTRLDALGAATRARLAEDFAPLHATLARWRKLLAYRPRFTTPAGDVARLATAYAEGGTAELTGLAALVEQEILRRAKAGSAVAR